ncbi:MAG TPA: hypothetical protein VN035_07550 [Microbacterium sp.]|nr:hypothetical protein [Microbacterium sp.]
MMTPNELRQHLGLRSLEGEDGRMLLGALGSVSAVLGDEKIEGHASWFDDLMSDPDKATGVHLRVLVADGVISLDYDFSFRGYPDARFLPWSRVRALRVIAEPGRQTVVANAWLETEEGDIEFAGARKDLFDEIVRAVRQHLR